MIPTNQLRFVERKYKVSTPGIYGPQGGPAFTTVRILQQFWADPNSTMISLDTATVGEWRDVPLADPVADVGS